jgi:beta-glucosidase
MFKKICSIAFFFYCFYANAQRFRDASLSVEQRVQDLLQNLTLQEKISLLGYNSKPVERLNIPAYNWWNEALHGVEAKLYVVFSVINCMFQVSYLILF